MICVWELKSYKSENKKTRKNFIPNRSCWNQTFELPPQTIIFSIFAINKRHVVYNFALPVYLRDDFIRHILLSKHYTNARG